MSVYVAHAEGDHVDTLLTIRDTREAARADLVAWCRDNWDDLFDDPAPADPRDVIAEFFENGDHTYFIRECEPGAPYTPREPRKDC